MNLLILEPYYGGSHQAFLTGLVEQLGWEWDLLELPARGWKWRMRLAAPCFAGMLAERAGQGPDRILCSSFVDVATLRALLPDRLRQVEVCTYFHENQFVYPVQQEEERDLHFAVTNYTTALASDRLAFNSRYNLESFLAGADLLLKKAPDMPAAIWQGFSERLRRQACILPPGIDFRAIAAAPVAPRQPAPVIVWNHRWEHDKNPELFFQTLFDLDRDGVDFRLIVLGQSFAQQPAVFAEARERLAARLLYFGYAPSREEYARLLKMGDLVVSTARHEFFGIAVVEAVRAGCRPLLPARLAYPELFPNEYLYGDDQEFAAALTAYLQQRPPFSPELGRQLTDRFSWNVLAASYREWLA
ncbi:MAG: hypothetical protein A2521_17105 [Deltaproteobacteria bacterium RIFOXYD12_FULL_57_12]|nr:MAG: hypothetical protein A2521_17105 [Deltaproteobacteria bacterium RIFOXYD12_FULL_57_12]